MNPLVVATLLAGALIGLGVGLAVLVLLPARVSLHDALTLDRSITSSAVREQEALHSTKVTEPSRLTLLGAALEDKLATWRITTPDVDLALIEWSRGRFLLVRLAATAFALLVGPVFWVMVALGGGVIPFVVPQGLSVFLGLAAWYVLGVWVKDRAAARRLEMREALVSYLTLLALFKASGEGMIGALQRAALVSEAWTFRRIDARLQASIRAGGSPQAGLRMLGEELGIDELGDVADITLTASTEGAGVFTTLLARADALRNEMQSDAESTASARSVRLGIPKAMLGFVGVAFLLYPLMSAVGGT